MLTWCVGGSGKLRAYEGWSLVLTLVAVAAGVAGVAGAAELSPGPGDAAAVLSADGDEFGRRAQTGRRDHAAVHCGAT